jgi:hypothetical protein
MTAILKVDTSVPANLSFRIREPESSAEQLLQATKESRGFRDRPRRRIRKVGLDDHGRDRPDLLFGPQVSDLPSEIFDRTGHEERSGSGVGPGVVGPAAGS